MKKIDRNSVLEAIEDCLDELERYRKSSGYSSITGYEVLPITERHWLHRGILMLRDSLGRKLPDCGSAVWGELLQAAADGRARDVELRVKELRLWLLYQQGKFTFGVRKRPEIDLDSSSSSSVSESSSSTTES